MLLADGTPLSTVFVSPALSPWRSFWGFGARNPAFREVIYSLEYGKLTLENVIQYYLDLPEANKDPNKAAEWKVEYSFRSAYGVRDVSPARTHTLLQQMKEYASDQFHKYHKYNHVSVGVGEYEPCGCQCKAWHLCAIGEVQRKPYERCVDEETTAQCAGASVLASVALVLAATVLQWMWDGHLLPVSMKTVFPGMGVPILKIPPPWDHVIFIMVTLYIEMPHCSPLQ